MNPSTPSSPLAGAPRAAGGSWLRRTLTGPLRGAVGSGKAYVSEVYQRAAAPRPLVVATSVPVRDDQGKILGLLVIQRRLSAITGWLKHVTLGEYGYVVVLDQNGTVAGHPALD